jgi:hypothetical protein
MPSPLERLRELLGVGLNEVPGAIVTAEVPVPDAVINRFITEALARSQTPVAAVRIETGDDDRFTAHVTVRGPRLIPELKLLAEIEQQPTPQSPMLVLRWALRGMGPLAMMAAPFLANLKGLPPGVRIDGERVIVNVAEVLRSRGLGELLPLITRLELGTRAGRAIVRLELRT